jgi:hypothetical protein
MKVRNGIRGRGPEAVCDEGEGRNRRPFVMKVGNEIGVRLGESEGQLRGPSGTQVRGGIAFAMEVRGGTGDRL